MVKQLTFRKRGGNVNMNILRPWLREVTDFDLETSRSEKKRLAQYLYSGTTIYLRAESGERESV